MDELSEPSPKSQVKESEFSERLVITGAKGAWPESESSSNLATAGGVAVASAVVPVDPDAVAVELGDAVGSAVD